MAPIRSLPLFSLQNVDSTGYVGYSLGNSYINSAFTYGGGYMDMGMQINPLAFMTDWFKFGSSAMCINGHFSGWGAGAVNCWSGGNMGNWWPCQWYGPSAAPAGNTTTSVSSSDPDKEKYDKLKAILDQYVTWYKSSNFGTPQCESKIKTIDESSDSYAQKLTKLQSEYNTLNKIDKFLQSSAGQALQLGSKTVGDVLEEIGLIDDAEEVEKKVAEDIIEQNYPTNTLANTYFNEGVSLMSVIGNYNSNAENFITNVLDSPDGLKKANELKALLVKEAKAQAENSNAGTYYKNLESMTANKDNKQAFINEFNKVYAQTRILMAKAAGNMIHTYYDFISADVLNTATEEDLNIEFQGDNATKGAVTTAKGWTVNSSARIGEREVIAADNIPEMEDQHQATKALEKMSEPGGALTKQSAKISVGDKKYDCYETNTTNNKKYYIVIKNSKGEEEIYEVTKTGNTWKKENKVTSWQSNIQEYVLDEITKEQELQRKKAEKVAKAAEVENKEKTLLDAAFGESPKNWKKCTFTKTVDGTAYNVYATKDKGYVIIKENMIYSVKGLKRNDKKQIAIQSIKDATIERYVDPNAQTYADNIAKYLRGHTSENDWKSFLALVKNNINAENILDVYKCYNNKNKEDLFEQLATENESASDGRKPGEQKHEQLINLIKYVIQYVDNHGGIEQFSNETLQLYYKRLKGMAGLLPELTDDTYAPIDKNNVKDSAVAARLYVNCIINAFDNKS